MTHVKSIHRFTGDLLNEGQILDSVYRHFMLAVYGDGARARTVRLEIEIERGNSMRTRLIGVAGLAVALTLLAGGAGASIHSASAASPGWSYNVGAGLDAGNLYRMTGPATQASDQACDVQGVDDATEANGEQGAANDTDNVQDENGADDATEANGEQGAANDTDTIECGDQSEGADASQAASSGAVRASLMNAQIQTDVEAPDGTESATSGDEAIDGIQYEQEGEFEGENGH